MERKKMTTKLTLTIEKETIELARSYASEQGQSFSEIIKNYLKLITVERRKLAPDQLSPRVKKLRGILKTFHR